MSETQKQPPRDRGLDPIEELDQGDRLLDVPFDTLNEAEWDVIFDLDQSW